MTKTGPAAEHASARAFNDYHPLGTPVRYWKGAREGDGKVARTRTEAQLLSGHTAVVWLEGVSGCIALTHIQPITEEELSAADRIPAPRPVPTFADRTATDAPLPTWLPDALDELRESRAKLAIVISERDQALATARRYAKTGAEALTARNAAENDLRSQTQALREALAERDEARVELRHVGQVLTDWRNAFTEEPEHEADRVLVDLIDAGLVPTAASSVPSRRAQEEPASDARRLLDQAIVDGLPLAGGRVRKLLKALRHELARVDAKRAEQAEG